MENEIASTVTALLPYPPERVWAVVTDLDRWQWRSDLRRLDHAGGGYLHGVRQKRLSHPLHHHRPPPNLLLGL